MGKSSFICSTVAFSCSRMLMELPAPCGSGPQDHGAEERVGLQLAGDPWLAEGRGWYCTFLWREM